MRSTIWSERATGVVAVNEAVVVVDAVVTLIPTGLLLMTPLESEISGGSMPVVRSPATAESEMTNGLLDVSRG